MLYLIQELQIWKFYTMKSIQKHAFIPLLHQIGEIHLLKDGPRQIITILGP